MADFLGTADRFSDLYLRGVLVWVLCVALVLADFRAGRALVPEHLPIEMRGGLARSPQCKCSVERQKLWHLL